MIFITKSWELRNDLQKKERTKDEKNESKHRNLATRNVTELNNDQYSF